MEPRLNDSCWALQIW